MTIYFCQTCAIPERRPFNARHRVGDSDRSQTCATIERRVYNGRYRVRDINRNQTCALIERSIFNARHRIGDSNRSQTSTKCKHTISKARHGVGNSDRSQTSAISERKISNVRHGVGNSDRSQTAAIIERIISNARHGVGDGICSLFPTWIANQFCLRFIKQYAINRRIGSIILIYIDFCQTAATRERTNSNARHGVANSDGGQTSAILERTVYNARYGILFSFIFYAFRNNPPPVIVPFLLTFTVESLIIVYLRFPIVNDSTGKSSTIFKKSFHTLFTSYLSLLPIGT